MLDEHNQLPIPGLTIGYRKYFKTSLTYSYTDLQLATPLGSVGIGKIKGNNQQYSNYRIKAWGGFIGNLSYDSLLNGTQLSNHNIGLIVVFPILLIPGYSNYVL